MTDKEIKSEIYNSDKNKMDISEQKSATFWVDHLQIDEKTLEDVDSKIYGDNIKKYRKYVGMSQRVLSQKLGISGAALTQIESGKRNQIDPVKLYEIAGILGCSPDNLLGRAQRFGYVKVPEFEVKSKCPHKELICQTEGGWNCPYEEMRILNTEATYPFRQLPNGLEINNLFNAFVLLSIKCPELYTCLETLLSIKNPVIYDRLYHLLWAVFRNELVRLGVSESK